MHEDNKRPIALPVSELKTIASLVATELKSADAVTPDLREQFVNVRAALYQRGIYDPVLVRFDSATAPRATVQEVGEQLELVAASL